MDESVAAADARNHVSLPGAGRAEAVLGTGLTYKAKASEMCGRYGVAFADA